MDKCLSEMRIVSNDSVLFGELVQLIYLEDPDKKNESFAISITNVKIKPIIGHNVNAYF